MDAGSHINDVTIKKEPPESLSPLQDDDSTNTSITDNASINDTRGANNQDFISSDSESKSSPHGSLRYVSRRGRPPGGGYSMKPHSHYVSFGSSSLMAAQDYGRQSTLGQTSLSPHDIMKTSLGSSLDALDARRFGFHSFEAEKNSFRCEGCDVVFSSRDTYAMHMLLRAKNESCVALPTSAISSNPENPTPREKFERELREKAMLAALRNQAAIMSKAAAAVVAPKSVESLSTLRRATSSNKDDIGVFGTTDAAPNLNNLFSFDTYGLYMDQRQYRRLLSEYGLRSTGSGGSLSAMMEQLSCSVCGELFTNKDALAMHMMFHTRDIESENKPAASLRSETLMNSSHNLNLSDLDFMGRTEQLNQGRHQENSKSNGDRQLTAERIAELKRIAIESSIRSSLKKHPINQDKNNLQSTRPKSVTEEMAVTSTAQTRPLSADDAFKISYSADKSIYKSFKPFSKWDPSIVDSNENFSRARTSRKRNLSASGDISYDNISLFSGAYSRRKQIRYDSNSFNALAKNSQYLKSFLSLERDKNSKVCDNHVSSASGPQDSDETSDGSSSAADYGQEESNANRKVGEKSSPSIDTIMSGDTILVPVENLDDIQNEGCKDIRERVANTSAGLNGPEITAIDFSVGKRDRSEEEDGIEDGKPGYSSSESHQDRYYSNAVTSFRYGSSDSETDNSRQLYHQQHHVELIPGGQTDGSRNLPPLNHSPLRSGEANGNSVDNLAESSSRVGEARYCPHCEILFLDVTLFHLHMGLHNVNNPWQCNTCGIICSGRLEFNTHVLHY